MEALGIKLGEVVLSLGFPGAVIIVLSLTVRFLYQETIRQRLEVVALLRENMKVIGDFTSTNNAMLEELRKRRI